MSKVDSARPRSCKSFDDYLATGRTWKSFDVWYSRAYLGDLLREAEGDFDETRAMIETMPEVQYKTVCK